VHPVATSNVPTLNSREARSVPNTTKRGCRLSAAVAVPRSLAYSLRACHNGTNFFNVSGKTGLVACRPPHNRRHAAVQWASLIARFDPK
jgi:hypothetical protein